MKNVSKLFLCIFSTAGALHAMKKPSQTFEAQLHAAAEKGDKREFIDLLKISGIDVNSQDTEGKTPLYIAVAGNTKAHFEIVKALFAIKEIKPLPDKEGNTILHAAIIPNGYYFYVKLLKLLKGLEKRGITKSLINVQNKQGRTPLHVAIGKIDEDIVLALLNAGASVTIKDKAGNTPLHEAVQQNVSMPIVKALLEKDATVMNEENNAGLTPLQVLLKTISRWEEYVTIEPSAQRDLTNIKEVAELFGHSGKSSVTKELKKHVGVQKAVQ